MQYWPDYAKPALAGWKHKSNYNVVRSNMDSGLAKQRARFSKPIVTRDISFFLTNEERALFEEWIKTNLKGGVDWFQWIDPLDKVVKQTRIVNGEVEWNAAGSINLWQGSLQLESVG